jgi:hypothetical protein
MIFQYIPSFIQIGSDIQKLLSGGGVGEIQRRTDRTEIA